MLIPNQFKRQLKCKLFNFEKSIRNMEHKILQKDNINKSKNLRHAKLSIERKMKKKIGYPFGATLPGILSRRSNNKST